MSEGTETLERQGLAKGLKVLVDVLLAVSLLSGVGFTIAWPIAGLTDKIGFDLSVPVSIGEETLLPTFSLVPTPKSEGSGADQGAVQAELPGDLPGLTLVKARGELRFSSADFIPSLLYWLHVVVAFGLLIYGLRLLRQILVATVEGRPFHPENPRRLNRLGWIIVLVGLIAPVSQFFFGAWAINQVEPTTVPIIASLDLQGEWIACGLLVLVLAAIWKTAAHMAEEQSLTV